MQLKQAEGQNLFSVVTLPFYCCYCSNAFTLYIKKQSVDLSQICKFTLRLYIHLDIENSRTKCSAEKLSTSCIWSGIFPSPSYQVHLFDQNISQCLPVSSFTVCIHVPNMTICSDLTQEFLLTSDISCTEASEDATLSNVSDTFLYLIGSY